ncbi:hypothetical protein M8C21_018162, partial [Ambrosia artemisiifolia]
PKQTITNPNPILQGSIKTEAVNDCSLGPSSCGVGKRNRTSKSTKKAKKRNKEPKASGACRDDSALGKFNEVLLQMIVLLADKDGILDLNKAAIILEV